MRTYFIFLLLIFLSSCSSKNEVIDEDVSQNDKAIFLEGLKFSKEKNYKEASSQFKKINDEFPYSDFSSKAQIYNAYINFQSNQIDESIISLKNYLNMNPSGEYAEYAHYMLGMCYYIQIADPSRDSSFTHLALKKFNYIIKNFPNSNFSKDSKFKVDFLQNFVAKKTI